MRLPSGVDAGLDLRYTGSQWLRGDEANETEPLGRLLTVGARRLHPRRLGGVRRGGATCSTPIAAIFGTFNENVSTGELERFLTPIGARTVKLVVRRVVRRGGTIEVTKGRSPC